MSSPRRSMTERGSSRERLTPFTMAPMTRFRRVTSIAMYASLGACLSILREPPWQDRTSMRCSCAWVSSSWRLESLQHVHGVDADLGHGVSALEHKQGGNSQRADEPAILREVVGPQLEKADRVVFEGIDAERYHERARREPIDPRQRRFEGRAPRAEIAPSRQRQVLVVPDALPGANL